MNFPVQSGHICGVQRPGRISEAVVVRWSKAIVTEHQRAGRCACVVSLIQRSNVRAEMGEVKPVTGDRKEYARYFCGILLGLQF